MWLTKFEGMTDGGSVGRMVYWVTLKTTRDEVAQSVAKVRLGGCQREWRAGSPNCWDERQMDSGIVRNWNEL
jgi:hypothetical protein